MEWTQILNKKRGSRTWQQFADSLGVSRQTLWNISNGVHQPSDKLLNALGLERRQQIVRAKAGSA